MILKDQAIPPSEYKPVIQRFEDIMRDINQAVQNSSLGFFSNLPSSYTKPSKKKKESEDDDDRRRPGRDGDKGWLVHRDNRKIQLPNLVDKICIDFAQLSFRCAEHYRNCPKGRHFTWRDVSNADKETLKAFVARNSHIELVLPTVRKLYIIIIR